MRSHKTQPTQHYLKTFQTNEMKLVVLNSDDTCTDYTLRPFCFKIQEDILTA
jgi:hypothetical protein